MKLSLSLEKATDNYTKAYHKVKRLRNVLYNSANYDAVNQLVKLVDDIVVAESERDTANKIKQLIEKEYNTVLEMAKTQEFTIEIPE